MPVPLWLRERLKTKSELGDFPEFLKEKDLRTICQEGRCPNIAGCFRKQTAAFLILGAVCTRRCAFCGIKKGEGNLSPPDILEPGRLGDVVKRKGIKHAVITSPTRDDLDDGGAGIFAAAGQAVREKSPGTAVEFLVPDFMGKELSLQKALDFSPEVLNHNIETVERLYRRVRPGADYRRSLKLIRTAKKEKRGIVAKSGLMVGLGERKEEVLRVMDDLREAGCDVLTIGQYFQPTFRQIPVVEYLGEEDFRFYREQALRKQFAFVACGSFARSSFQAAEAYKAVLEGMDKERVNG